MMNDDRIPILIGAGQYTQRDVDLAEAKEPLLMMVEAARRAAADAGADSRLLTHVDHVAVANIFGWHYGNPPRALAEQIGAQPATAVYTTIGGNTPQWLVNETAGQIASGAVRLALLAGGEAVYTVARARRAGVQLQWSSGIEGGTVVVGDPREGTNDHEKTHGLVLPAAIYPLFENALRTHYRLSLAEHRTRLGKLCSRLSAVAAQNPFAWFREERSAEEIATVTPENRLIGFPYPKYMNAIMDVDQSAAVLMTSVAQARSLRIDPSRWVYLWGCADVNDRWFVSDRADYYSSPGIRVAGETALAMAGLSVDQVDAFDLYSCFPSAVQIARDMLGISVDDPRPLTVTGGLPYHGGPGNNYTLHAIATMMNRVREKPGSTGLVSGLGWYLTKHSIGVYSNAPQDGPFVREDPKRHQERLDGGTYPELAKEPSGRGTIETYTVLHGRDGSPVRGIVIGRLDGGRRFFANTPDDRALLESLMTREGVGRPGMATTKGGVNRFDPD